MNKTKKGQSLSFDAITAIGLFIFLLIIAVLYYFNLNQDGIQQTLAQEAIVISQNLLSVNQPGQSLTDMGALDDKKIIAIMERLLDPTLDNQEEYQKIKLEFGIRDDFCIYLEDEDGNLIMLQVEDTGTKLAPVIFGSQRANYTTSNIATRFIECNIPRR